MASASFSPNAPNRQRITLAHIDSVVSARLGPTRGLGKSQPACFNRQIAMYLASHVGRWSTTVIGRFYGGRDHSTVVHSIQRIEALQESDPEIEALLSDLKSKIVGGCDQATNMVVAISKRSPKPVPSEPEMQLLAERVAFHVCELIRHELSAGRIQRADASSNQEDAMIL